MKSSEILSIGEAVLMEEPRSPQQAVLFMQRKALQIGIRELTDKRDRFERAIEKLERDLDRVEKLAEASLLGDVF